MPMVGSLLQRAKSMAATGAINLWAAKPLTQSMIGGAAIGGLYGAFSDNTSVLGGMAMGAGLGAAGLGAAKLGRKGYRAYMGARMSSGVGRRAAMGAAVGAMGAMSSRFIGSSYNRAVNGFQGLRNRFF